MNEQDLPETEQALTPEQEAVDAKLREAERQKRELEQAGWH